MNSIHFLRPSWLFLFLVLLGLGWLFLRKTASLYSWRAVCDPHLLDYLLEAQKADQKKQRSWILLPILLSGVLMIISLAGPTWSRLPVPTYQLIQPRVIVLDMSERMLIQDLLPNRLERAKFKLHDLFKRRDVGQLGLVVYTGEPFVVSPLTEDAQTIDALLSSLNPEIMPVDGLRMDKALLQASQLITQAGFHYGEILLLTTESPSANAISIAKRLADNHIFTSILPIAAPQKQPSSFQALAVAGHGLLLSFSDTSRDLEQWLKSGTLEHYNASQQKDMPLWRDEGRWFLLPAILFLLPLFRRGWLQRIKG